MRFPPAGFGCFTLLLSALAPACEVLPKDNFRSFDLVREQRVLKVGAAEQHPWVQYEGDAVRGIEAELVETFARKLGAQVQWSRGSQLELAERLHQKELHLLVGGFEAKAPISEHVAFTRPYVDAKDVKGKMAQHVLSVMPGESRLLYELDKFLLDDPAAKQIAARVGTLP